MHVGGRKRNFPVPRPINGRDRWSDLTIVIDLGHLLPLLLSLAGPPARHLPYYSYTLALLDFPNSKATGFFSLYLGHARAYDTNLTGLNFPGLYPHGPFYDRQNYALHRHMNRKLRKHSMQKAYKVQLYVV